jgi:hypothetical protein
MVQSRAKSRTEFRTDSTPECPLCLRVGESILSLMMGVYPGAPNAAAWEPGGNVPPRIRNVIGQGRQVFSYLASSPCQRTLWVVVPNFMARSIVSAPATSSPTAGSFIDQQLTSGQTKAGHLRSRSGAGPGQKSLMVWRTRSSPASNQEHFPETEHAVETNQPGCDPAAISARGWRTAKQGSLLRSGRP